MESCSTAPSATASGFGYTLYYTTDFIFAGLAVSLAFHAGLFNIGPEGQAYVGGLGVILIGLALNGMHWAFVFPLMIICGAAFGAFWAFIPGYLQAKRGSHIVITTILFNFIAVSVMSFLITRILKPVGVNSDESAPLEAITRVPQLKSLLRAVQELAGQHHLLPRDRCAVPRLLADLAHQVRLRRPRPRSQPDGRQLCRASRTRR